MVILKFSILRMFRNPTVILATLLLPIFLMNMPNLWNTPAHAQIFGVAGRGYYFISLVMLFGAFPLTSNLTAERTNKTIIRIMSTPTTNLSYLIQHLIACMVPMILQIAVVLVIGPIRYNWTPSFTAVIGLLYILFAFVSITFCFAWNALFKKSDISYTALSMVLTFASFILLMPLSIYPDIIRNLFMILPTYWIASGLEELITYGATYTLWITCSVLILYVVIFLTYGSKRGVY